MKKGVAVLLACVLIFSAFMLPSFAEDNAPEGEFSDAVEEGVVAEDVVCLKIPSDIVNLTFEDYGRLIQILSNNVDYNGWRQTIVTIYDRYGYDNFNGRLEAGRTYLITYHLKAINGYEVPEGLSVKDMQIETGKGVKSLKVLSDSSTIIVLQAKVLVDGTIAERIRGFFKDIGLKFQNAFRVVQLEIWDIMGKDKDDH